MRKLFAFALLLSCSKIIAQPPAGYYNNATGKSCATLKTALKTILNTGNNPRSYAALWTQYISTDVKPRTVGTGSANVIYDIYSTVPNGTDPYQFTPSTDQCGTYSGEGDCYNREHSVPQSWFGGSTANGPGTDYLHIYPTDGKVNAQHGNDVYGEVATANWTSLNGTKRGSSAIAGITGTVFEPIDSFKGDIARSFLYFVTMYEDNMTTYATNADATRAFDGNTFPSVKIEYLKMMIKWHKLDPVSAKEKARNNAAYSFQTNRNPYIDHPEWVDSVWNGTCPGLAALPVDIISFMGKVNGNYLTLNWEVGSEINLLQYEVERSFNGTNFTTIAQIEAKNLYQYSYNENVEEIRGRRVYYRIKKIDKNGKYAYSNLFTIHIPLNTKFSIYPNPAKDVVNLQFSNIANINTTMIVTDIAGKTIFKKQITAANGKVAVNTTNLTNGTYFVHIIINNETLVSKLIINK